MMESIRWGVLISILITICPSTLVNGNDLAHLDEDLEAVTMDQREPGSQCFVDGRCVDSSHVDGSVVSFDKS
jgi:hypothetical protein